MNQNNYGCKEGNLLKCPDAMKNSTLREELSLGMSKMAFRNPMELGLEVQHMKSDFHYLREITGSGHKIQMMNESAFKAIKEYCHKYEYGRSRRPAFCHNMRV